MYNFEEETGNKMFKFENLLTDGKFRTLAEAKRDGARMFFDVFSKLFTEKVPFWGILGEKFPNFFSIEELFPRTKEKIVSFLATICSDMEEEAESLFQKLLGTKIYYSSSPSRWFILTEVKNNSKIKYDLRRYKYTS